MGLKHIHTLFQPNVGESARAMRIGPSPGRLAGGECGPTRKTPERRRLRHDGAESIDSAPISWNMRAAALA